MLTLNCSKQHIKKHTKLFSRIVFVAFLTFLSFSAFGQKTLQQAERAFAAQNYNDALELYKSYEKEVRDSIQKHPYLLRIAMCYSNLNNPITAIKYYQLALKIDDRLSDEEGLDYINVLIETGQYHEARSFLENFDGIIYFENIIFNTCDYALQNPDIDNSKQITPIADQKGEAVYGLFLMNGSLYYTIPELLNKRQNSETYQYNLTNAKSTRLNYINKNIEKSSLYTPTYNETNKMLYFSDNISNDKVYYESIRADQKIGAGGSNNLGIFKLSLDSNNVKGRSEILSFINFEYNTTHPHFSPDGKTLYFTTDIPGGYGGYDLYYSTNENGLWSRPINLGAEVNTIMDEGYPFVIEDKLYFASKGHPGYGGLDIFEFDLNTREVKNVGKPINSSFDDFYYIKTDSHRGYFISNRDQQDGKDIIYFFEKN